MEGQGVNGLVMGTSQVQPGQVLVKTNLSRSWTSIIECVSATGVALSPLVIFKAKSIQDQWFKDQFLEKHPTWQVAFSENGWTSNDIALKWLEKIFLPETDPQDPSQARLLIIDGHGSHTTNEFIIECFLNNVFLLFLLAYTSHIIQPLDLGCFSSLKAAYCRFVGNFVALTDETKLGKARFLEFYAEAHEIAFCKSNIQSG
jgi:4-hydroxybenzoate polyprenyltransferase